MCEGHIIYSFKIPLQIDPQTSPQCGQPCGRPYLPALFREVVGLDSRDGFRGPVPCPVSGANNPSTPWTALDAQVCRSSGGLSHRWRVLTCHLQSPQRLTTDVIAANSAFLQGADSLNRDDTVWVSWQINPFFSCDLHAGAGRASPRAPSRFSQTRRPYPFCTAGDEPP